MGDRKGYGGRGLVLTALPFVPFVQLLFVEFLLTTDVGVKRRICTSVLPGRAVTFPFEAAIGFLLKSFEDAMGTSFGEISENSAAPGDEVPVAGGVWG